MSLDLQQYVGQEAEPPRVARFPVNEAMIRHWVEALDDQNPVYVDPETARANGLSDVIAPPAMISTWVMSGYRRYREVQRRRAEGVPEDSPYARLMHDLDRAGYTSVVATDVEQEFHREVQPGQHVTCHYVIESVSDEKATALGAGHFVTLHKEYVDQDGQTLAEERFRLLRFRPRSQA